jgi:CHAT domain-containing protein
MAQWWLRLWPSTPVAATVAPPATPEEDGAVTQGTPEIDALPPALAAWLRTPTWFTSRHWLIAHFLELPAEAKDRLQQAAVQAHASGEGELADLLARHAALLETARRVGVDRAYQQLVGDSAFLASEENLSEGAGDMAALQALGDEFFALARRGAAVDRQVELGRHILALDATAHALTSQERYAVLGLLGNTLMAQARQPGGAKLRILLKEALAYYDRALHERPLEEAPHDWALMQNNLGAVLSNYVVLAMGTERAHMSAAAVEAFRAALRILIERDTPTDWAGTQHNLGTALCQQAQLVAGAERAHLLAEAAEACRAALRIRTERDTPTDWAGTQHNLGTALCQQAQLVAGAERAYLLAEAVDAYQAALRIRTERDTPADWAWTQNNLGTALTTQAKLATGAERTELLAAAVHAYRAALLVLTEQGMPTDWAATQYNLGTALRDQANLASGAERAQLLAAAVDAYRGPYRIAPVDLFSGAQRTAARVLAAGLVTSALGRPEVEADNLLAEAQEVAASGLQAAALLEQQAPSLEFRQAEWAENARLFSLAATIEALLGRPQAALLLLEAGRARGLAELQGQRRAQLEVLHDTERAAYNQSLDAVREVEARGRLAVTQADRLSLVPTARAANAQLAKVVARLRQAHADFLPEHTVTVAELANTLRSEEVLLYVVPQPMGTLLVALAPSGACQAEVLLEFTADGLFDLAVQRDAEGYNRLGYLPAVMGFGSTLLDEALDALLPTLGERLMAPALRLVKRLGGRRTVVVPGGLLAVLPLHAATYLPLDLAQPHTAADGRRYVCDDLPLIYVPSGGAYVAARSAAARSGRPTRGLVVGNPQLTEHAADWTPNTPGYLPSAQREATEVALLMELAGFGQVEQKVGSEATWSTVVQGLQACDVAHLSLHAYFDYKRPLDSALLVAPNVRLFLRSLLDERTVPLTHLRLAVLSACQTGLGDFQQLSEEAVGLLGALLTAGAAGVVGSLWPVYDISTATLMQTFTRGYLLDGLEPDAALQAAQRAFREGAWTQYITPPATSDMQTATEDEPQPALAAVASRQSLSDGTLRQLGVVRRVPQASDQAGEALAAAERRTDWSHPIHWAAFVYYGA